MNLICKLFGHKYKELILISVTNNSYLILKEGAINFDKYKHFCTRCGEKL